MPGLVLFPFLPEAYEDNETERRRTARRKRHKLQGCRRISVYMRISLSYLSLQSLFVSESDIFQFEEIPNFLDQLSSKG